MTIRNETAAIVNVYAEAILNQAIENKIEKQILEEIELSLAGIISSKPLMNAMETVSIDQKEKHQLIDKILPAYFSDLMKNTFHLMIDKRRFFCMKEALVKTRELIEAKSGIRPGTVTTPWELSVEEKEKMQKKLEEICQKKLHLDFEVKKEILGGVIFRSEDLLVDDSIKGHLTKMKKKIMAADL